MTDIDKELRAIVGAVNMIDLRTGDYLTEEEAVEQIKALVVEAIGEDEEDAEPGITLNEAHHEGWIDGRNDLRGEIRSIYGK